MIVSVASGFPGGSEGKESACHAGDLGWKDPLEKGTATHSSLLACRIPRTTPWGWKSRTQLSDFHSLCLWLVAYSPHLSWNEGLS